MARYLALDWDHRLLHLVAADVKGGAVQLRQAAVFPEEHGPNPAEAEALGRRLREHLRAAGIAPAPVLACVGRDRVVLKEVRYPAVPAAEEPAVVRFQVSKELTEPLEEVVLDYAPIESNGSSGERRALVLIVRRELLAGYQALCQSAGLKLLALVPRPFGILACPGLAVAPGEAAASLILVDRWAELCVGHGESLLFARSLARGPSLAGEVRRNLAVYGGQWPQHPVRSLRVAGGGDQTELLRRLCEMPGILVESFDPLAGLEGALPAAEHGAFTGAVGLLQVAARRGTQPVNFVRPKQPKQTKDPTKRRLAVAAAAAVLILLGGVGYGYTQIAKKDRQLEHQLTEKAALDRQLLDVEEMAKRIKALDDWTATEVVWLDELYDLTDRFPDTESLRLVSLNADPVTVASKGKGPVSKQVARISLKGITTADYQAVDGLLARWVTEGHYNVGPKKLARNTGVDRFRFLQEFTTKVEVEKRPPSAYVRRLPAGDDKSAGSDRGRDRGQRRGGDGGANGNSGFNRGRFERRTP